MKISREGIVLIKSFEGFRPRAIQRENGGWVIGYGHTLSAREGATVSEADAELLLRYDLLPVEKSVNETVPAPLNQHQFDAVISFAFSLGLERFASSDVLARLTSGTPGEAADAMMGWPEPQLRETALRRRAAERALFIADPAAPVALSDLLAAPLPAEVPATEALVEPPTAEPGPVEPGLVDPGPAEPVSLEEDSMPQPAEPAVDEAAADEAAAVPDSRSAAVAALLGETDTPEDSDSAPASVIPAFSAPVWPDVQTPAVAEATDLAGIEEPVSADVTTNNVVEVEVEEAARISETGDGTADPEVLAEAAVPAEAAAPEQTPDSLPDVTAPGDPETVEDDLSPPPAVLPAVDPVAMAVARYAPYSAAMVGPLPYLRPAAPRIEPPAPVPVPDIPAAEVALLDADTPDTATAAADETPPISIEAGALEAPEAAAAAPLETAREPAPQTIVFPQATPYAGRSEAELDTPTAEVLVLTPMEATSELTMERPLWTPEQRGEPASVSETSLFSEDLMLVRGGGALLRHEVEPEAPVRFDWSETGPFVFMGGVGLVSFGASMAAFRRAGEQSGGSELTIIGWVLALIGLACVGVSSFKLYRRWGLPGGD